MPIEVRQPFAECLISIWVDGHLSYQNRFRAEKKSRFLHMGSSNAAYLTVIPVPSGAHSIRAEVKAPKEAYEGRGTLSATLSKAESHKLQITVDRSNPELGMQLN